MRREEHYTEGEEGEAMFGKLLYLTAAALLALSFWKDRKKTKKALKKAWKSFCATPEGVSKDVIRTANSTVLLFLEKILFSP